MDLDRFSIYRETDLNILRDKLSFLESVVSDEDLSKEFKIVKRNACPECGGLDIAVRKTLLPPFRCPICKITFEENF